MKKFIISIDQGTTSSRAILFDLKGKPVFISQTEFTQYFPRDGWVEHNPEEIWKTTLKVLKEVIKKSKQLKGKALTIGITNQRETTILWDKKTGKAVYNAIVWQDRRSSEYCKKLIKNKKETIIYNKTGLLIDAYFSATKIKWIIDNEPKVQVINKIGKSYSYVDAIDAIVINAMSDFEIDDYLDDYDNDGVYDDLLTLRKQLIEERLISVDIAKNLSASKAGNEPFSAARYVEDS